MIIIYIYYMMISFILHTYIYTNYSNLGSWICVENEDKLETVRWGLGKREGSFTWTHLDSLEFTWIHLDSFGFT